MQELGSSSDIVGRTTELRELGRFLERTQEGNGGALLISGEAGIGKTALVRNLMAIAASRGFKVLSGECAFESLTPYMPFLEALRSGGLEHLFADEAPRVEGAFLITGTGLLVKEVLRERTGLDPDIFASMLTTVSDFVKDSLSMLSGEKKGGTLNTLGYENYRILMEGGVGLSLAVIITGRENEFLINDMRDVLSSVQERYGRVLEDWDGGEERIGGIEGDLEPLMAPGRYDGTRYGPADPKVGRNLLFENVSMGLLREAADRPILLCLEDLQWADRSSLALLRYVSKGAGRSPIMVVGTYRPEDVGRRAGDGPGLREFLRSMTREEGTESIELGRLDMERTFELMSSMTGRDEFPRDFKDRIFRETEGNPLFVTELMRLLAAEGRVLERGGAWMLLGKAGDVRIPSKVCDVIAGRLERLSREQRKVLDYASVMGDEFDPGLLAEVMGQGRIGVLEVLRDAESDHRLVHVSGGSCRFDHAKIKEVLYSEIPEMLRGEYHFAIASKLEERHAGDIGSAADVLAYHYYRRRDREKGLKYLLMAAERARERYATAESIDHFRKALELLGDDGRIEDRLRVLDSLVELSLLHGELDDCLDYSNRMLELCGKVGDRKGMAKAHHTVGLVMKRRGEWYEAVSSLERAMALAGETGDLRRKAEILRDLGYVHERRGRYGDAREVFGKALEAATEANDGAIMGGIFEAFGTLSDIQGDRESAIEQFRKALGFFEGSGDLLKTAAVYGDLGVTSFLKGDLNEAIEYDERSIELSKRVGDIRGLGYGLVNAAEAYTEKRDVAKAMEYLDRALGIFERLEEKMMVAAVHRNYGMAHAKKGEWTLAADGFQKALDIYENQVDAPYYQAYTYYHLGKMLAERAERSAARESLGKAHMLYKRLGMEKDAEKVKKDMDAL